jgi:hypothetical protein
VPAAYQLGVVYAAGIGVETNHTESFKWYRKAALQGVNLAQFNVALAYKEGKGVEKNLVESYTWAYAAARRVGKATLLTGELRKSLSPEEMDRATSLATELVKQIEEVEREAAEGEKVGPNPDSDPGD